MRLGSPTAAVLLPAIAAAAVLTHGYHLGADDAAIYVPAIKKAANPALYPFGDEFFMSHAHLSLFPDLVGGSARLLGLPADFAIFAWHVIGVFLLLWAGWRLACACFPTPRARWCAVALLAGALSIPVAGTALVIMDPYLTARSLSAPATLFAVACWVSNQRKRSVGWLAVAGLVHPQMCIYGVVLIAILAVRLPRLPGAAFGAVLPTLFDFRPPTGPAREALLARTFFFLYNWAWYEWLGAVAPLAILWWWGRARFKATTPAFHRLSRALVPFGLLFSAAGIALSSSEHFQNLARLQPMRGFHLVYAIFFVLLGGLAGEYLLRSAPWRWAALFLPLAAGMWVLQQQTYPYSPHVEWPGARASNPWIVAMLWIRANTPTQAVFALDPNYMRLPGEDQHGFRAVAERSVLADYVKDSGAVSLFPALAHDWDDQVRATTGFERFGPADFARLARRFGVSWVVTQAPPPDGVKCPYANRAVAVCRIE